ncbi:MAG: hypothetical protein AAF253_15085 [Pseudomonadota bacterium]
MFTDPLFDRHRDAVWPMFWPVFVLAILLFRQRSRALLASGCRSIGYEVTPFGMVYITDTSFPADGPGWKDDLFSATGAYGDAGTALGSAVPGAIAREALCPTLVLEAHILSLNWVIRRRAQRQRLKPSCAHSPIGLPLPHT